MDESQKAKADNRGQLHAVAKMSFDWEKATTQAFEPIQLTVGGSSSFTMTAKFSRARWLIFIVNKGTDTDTHINV